jgi:chorismate synthase
MLRWITAGESHGPVLTAVLEGMPAGVAVTTADVTQALARRRLGYGRGARQKFETDSVALLGGIRHGRTQGGPIALQIGNSEWPRWEQVMSPDPVDAAALAKLARNAPLTRPRPGHADLVGMQKYGFEDARPVLERASARETAARVALGALAKALLAQAAGVRVFSHVVRIGTVASDAPPPTAADLEAIDADPVRCAVPEIGEAMVAEIDAAKADADTLGGVVEVIAEGVPPGLGSYVHSDRRLDSRIAGALMGIQAIKGVEVGDGFDLAAMRGSTAQDEIFMIEGRIVRRTAHSGGTEGGMSTGQPLRVRAAMKPISTVPRALRTIDVATGEAATAINQRSDACAVPAAGVIAEAMVALVLADALLEKTGGDSLAEVTRNLGAYLDTLGADEPEPA